MQSAEEIINNLNLKPHPEGGHYHETYLDPERFNQDRKLCSIIYYLLKFDEVSHWHRVDATECWFWHAGAPIALSVSIDNFETNTVDLGPELKLNQKLHFVVPKNCWQMAVSLGKWSLVSCLVTPSFQFSGFELAPDNWNPSPEK